MRRTKFVTYYKWAQYHRVAPGSPYIQYRCAKCGKGNTGQEGCVPRNWFKIPNEYDPSVRYGKKSFRFKGLLCERCGDEWTHHPIPVTEGVSVSPNVAERLTMAARREIHSKNADLLGTDAGWFVIIGGFTLIGGLITLASGSTAVGRALVAIGVTIFSTGGALGIFYYPQKRNRLEVLAQTRMVELAEERRDTIEERQTFYGSPEWKAIRAEVIHEQGRACNNCGIHIRLNVDLTVDHIKPRSIYPELSLVKNNLQVLCRACNSSKGATE